MKIDELALKYKNNKLSEEQFELAKSLIIELDGITEQGVDDAAIKDIDQLIAKHLKEKTISKEMFYGLMRYFYMINRTDLYIRLTQYTGGIGVIEAILDRLKNVNGLSAYKRVEAQFQLPPLGTSPMLLPIYINQLMDILKKELKTEALLSQVLSGNNHGIPDEAFLAEKAAYEASESLTDYLKGYHERQIKTLREYAKTGKPWFEQKITDEVVDYVASNSEIQGGVFKDGYIYETKIPYDIISWLHAETAIDKRYFACHCPFARESIKDHDVNLDPLWCHCSGGFAKKRYEVIFGRPLTAVPLENALKGDSYCRFAIDVRDIPNLK